MLTGNPLPYENNAAITIHMLNQLLCLKNS